MVGYVALLRGINVGGHQKLAMADLRTLATDLGYGQVATHVQSGNLVFTSPSQDSGRLAGELEEEIAARHAFAPMVLVLAAGELTRVIAANPYPEVGDPQQLHVIFRWAPLSAEEADGVATAGKRAAEQGSPDTATIVDGVLYLHTPGGLGRSVLAAQLGRAGGAAAAGSTTRNWRTVTKLAALLDGLAGT